MQPPSLRNSYSPADDLNRMSGETRRHHALESNTSGGKQLKACNLHTDECERIPGRVRHRHGRDDDILNKCRPGRISLQLIGLILSYIGVVALLNGVALPH